MAKEKLTEKNNTATKTATNKIEFKSPKRTFRQTELPKMSLEDALKAHLCAELGLSRADVLIEIEGRLITMIYVN